MKLNQYRPIFNATVIAIIIFIIHKFFFYYFFPNGVEDKFIYSIELLYCFFLSLSIIILFILVKVNKKNINNVGFTFLLLTCLKMIIAYIFLNPILNQTQASIKFEKFNFFAIFIIFLTIETILTIGILNKKQ